MKLFIKQIHRQRQQTCGCQEGGLVAEWIGSLGVAAAKCYILNG